MMTMAERIKGRRRQLKLNQAELGAMIGVSQMQVSRFESGIGEPSASELILLARSLQTTPHWLLGYTAEHTSELALSDIEKEVIQLFRSKEPHRRYNILEIVRVAN